MQKKRTKFYLSYLDNAVHEYVDISTMSTLAFSYDCNWLLRFLWGLNSR